MRRSSREPRAARSAGVVKKEKETARLQGFQRETHNSKQRVQPAPSAGKHATSAKRGKTRTSRATIGFGFAPDWLKKQRVRETAWSGRAEKRSWHAARIAGSSARGFKMPSIHGEIKVWDKNAKKQRRGWKDKPIFCISEQ